MSETCPHGVTLGQRCFACNSADTLPLTMPDQLSRDLAEARAKLAALEVLAKLRAHPGFEDVLWSARSHHDARFACAADPALAHQRKAHERAAGAMALLIELLGGANG